MTNRILVATHKNYAMPSDPLYLPIFVGKRIHPDVNKTFQGDDTGDNISIKNSSYNELTALYWGWKNLDNDAVGLVHYRRYLSTNHKKNLNSVLSTGQLNDLMSEYDVVLPKKRNYYIETNYSHYVHAHRSEPLDVTRNIISENFSDYLESFDTVMKRRSAHMFNMLVMKKKYYDMYCEWLFSILAQLEGRIDTSSYGPYERRVYGFVSELLLDVWLDKNALRSTEVNFVYMERQNWLLKGWGFIKRKFSHSANR